MGFTQAIINDEGKRVGGYARIWSATKKELSTNALISTTKRKQDGTYEADFQTFVSFVGNAHKKLHDVSIPEKNDKSFKGIPIQILRCESTTRYDSQKAVTYHNYAVFDFEFSEKVTTTPAKPASKLEAEEFDETTDLDLPF